MQVIPYREEWAEHWDEFCSKAYMASLLHKRRFLSYHGTRFQDVSLVIVDQDKWLGVLPAAIDPTDNSVVVSHPGVTYGGLIHGGALRGDAMLQALQAVMSYYSTAGFVSLCYKVIPTIYHCVPSQDDIYAMFRLNAKRYRCDITSTIDLENRLPVSKRRQRSLKKAKKAGIQIVTGAQYATGLWSVLEENLARKYDTRPVHSLSEILLLHQRFPKEIKFICGLVNETVEAGIVIFSTPIADHVQYIASTEDGYKISALDAIFEEAIESAKLLGKRYFNFGISTEKNGWFLNEGLFRFKSEFGAGSSVHEFYEIVLEK